MTLVQMLES